MYTVDPPKGAHSKGTELISKGCKKFKTYDDETLCALSRSLSLSLSLIFNHMCICTVYSFIISCISGVIGQKKGKS